MKTTNSKSCLILAKQTQNLSLATLFHDSRHHRMRTARALMTLGRLPASPTPRSERNAYGGVDRQRNDHMGWFRNEHRWQYDPSTDTWTATSTSGAPSGRSAHTTVWTGSEMIAWGGYDGKADVNTGGKYNPTTNTWVATSISNAPSEREFHSAVWTGSEMIVWGGLNNVTFVNTGGRYDTVTDTWTATSNTSAPSIREAHTAVWTGSEMIVWGGELGSGSATDTGRRYVPHGKLDRDQQNERG